MPICNNCGMVAVVNHKEKEAECRNCKTSDISICSLPYACKLLFQELMAMGVNPRIGMRDKI